MDERKKTLDDSPRTTNPKAKQQMQIFCHGLKEEDFQVEFTDHKIFFGRDESNSIVVVAEGISRFHAVLIEEDEELFLKDNDSLNGTFLNYKPVRGQQKLVNGDIIQVGYRLIRVDFKPEQDAVILDFVSPEETEVVSNDSAAVPPVFSEPGRTPIAGDDNERTAPVSETAHSRSSASGTATETLNMTELTFPPHKAGEPNEQAGKNVVEESPGGVSSDSGIVPPQLSPWRLVIHDKRFVLSSVFVVSALCILFFFLGKHSAQTPREFNSVVISNQTVAERYNRDPLLVTTDQDVLNPNDSVNSLREALFHAQNYSLNKTVSFEKDCVIRLTSSLAVFNPVSIDGGEHDVTIIGPETEPMFRVKDASLTVKNMILLSDCSGDSAGIMDISLNIGGGSIWDDNTEDISTGLTRLISVKDGGKAQTLWRILAGRGKGLILEGESHIHRLSAKGSDIRVRAGSVLENATLSGGQISVRGTLKDSTIGDSNTGNISAYLHEGGLYENLTMKEGSSLMTGTGTVNGIRIGSRSSLIYENGCTLNGTISIGGLVMTKYGHDGKRELVYPKLGPDTDIIFDLTVFPRKGDFIESTYHSPETDIKKSFQESNSFYPLVFHLSGFLDVRSFTIQTSGSQPAGIYLLAGNAAGFNAPVSLKIGDVTHSGVLSVGKSFTKDGKVYSLSLEECRKNNNYSGKTDMLVLTIQ